MDTPDTKIICHCHGVSKDVIEKAVASGATSLHKIYELTTAGVGPCGGSCRRIIATILEKKLNLVQQT
jgi:bacterioferritin-associated ferredoxin